MSVHLCVQALRQIERECAQPDPDPETLREAFKEVGRHVPTVLAVHAAEVLYAILRLARLAETGGELSSTRAEVAHGCMELRQMIGDYNRRASSRLLADVFDRTKEPWNE